MQKNKNKDYYFAVHPIKGVWHFQFLEKMYILCYN